MADLRIEKYHQLDLQAARIQAKKWLAEAQAQFDFVAHYQEGTDGDTVSIKKSGVDGRAFLNAQKIVFEADLGFLAKPFKGMIYEGITEGLDKFFA